MTPRFELRIACCAAEIEAAQHLRHRIFRGMEGLDCDAFDARSTHLIVLECATGKTVGTYRLLHGTHAPEGLYTEQEFIFDGLDSIRNNLCETGRACVDPAFRDGAAIALLWRGFVLLREHPGFPPFRYLLGCASLAADAPWEDIFQRFDREGRLSSQLCAVPRQAPAPSTGGDFALSPLLKGYLRLGAEICGPPAFDADFNTIDFPILLDWEKITPRYARHFF